MSLNSTRNEEKKINFEETKSTRLDTDNDGVPDAQDICPTGNGVVIVSVDYYLQESAMLNFDPYFKLGVDGDGDGNLDITEIWGDADFCFPDMQV